MRCEAITRSGSRCRLNALAGASWCYGHDPAREEERRRNASKAGRSGGNGRPGSAGTELAQTKRQIRNLIAEIRAGDIERGPAAVMLQAYNVLARYLEIERRVSEAELEERLDALERAVTELAENASAVGAAQAAQERRYWGG